MNDHGAAPGVDRTKCRTCGKPIRRGIKSRSKAVFEHVPETQAGQDAPKAAARRQTARTVTRGGSGTHTPANPQPAVAPTPTARKPQKNGVAVDKAARQAQEIIKGLIEKIIAARGDDTVGDGDQWAAARREGVDDYTYDLAVEVRKLRGQGAAWWRIAYELQLPGHGPSAIQGKSGAAFARRLWERAWGKTYTDGERAPRETKADKRERAVTMEARPVFSEETPESEIISRIMGQSIHWNARVGNGVGAVVSPQEAFVHPDPRTIRIIMGPKGRVVEFFEAIDAAQLKVDPARSIAKTGPRRSVYLSRIERVGA